MWGGSGLFLRPAGWCLEASLRAAARRISHVASRPDFSSARAATHASTSPRQPWGLCCLPCPAELKCDENGGATWVIEVTHPAAPHNLQLKSASRSCTDAQYLRARPGKYNLDRLCGTYFTEKADGFICALTHLLNPRPVAANIDSGLCLCPFFREVRIIPCPTYFTYMLQFPRLIPRLEISSRAHF